MKKNFQNIALNLLMEYIMKSILKNLAVASIGLVSLGYADQDGQQEVQSKLPMQTITPSAGPRVENAIDGVFTVDFIYFDATQTGLDFARNNLQDSSEVTSQGSIYYPNFGFDPGFRLGFGLDLAHDAWDVMAEYTYFHTGTRTNSYTYADTATQTVDNLADQETLTSARSHWRLKLDVLDVDLGRNYYISQYLAMRPFFGAKTLWNRETYNVTAAGPQLALDNTAAQRQIRQYQYAFGFGIRTGLDTSWQFTRNWNIYGNAAFSLMNTHQKVEVKTLQYTEAGVFTGYTQSAVSDQNTIQPVVEFGMGLGYDCFFDDDNYHFGIKAGWEFNYFNNNNYFVQPFGISADDQLFRFGDLSIQGFDLQLRLDF
jgi:hypothetical protein